MRRFLTTLLIFLIAQMGYAQFFNYGIKGGLNYNSNGDLIATDLSNNSIRVNSNEETGFHVGLLSEIRLPLFLYIRPELVYTHTESSYEIEGSKSKLKIDKIDIPVLVGFRVFKLGRVFLGPNFQYLIDTDLSSSELIDNISHIGSDDFSISGQFGLGIDLGRFGADVRWETGFTDTQASFIGDIIGEEKQAALLTDTQAQQFIFSLYYTFN